MRHLLSTCAVTVNNCHDWQLSHAHIKIGKTASNTASLISNDDLLHGIRNVNKCQFIKKMTTGFCDRNDSKLYYHSAFLLLGIDGYQQDNISQGRRIQRMRTT